MGAFYLLGYERELLFAVESKLFKWNVDHRKVVFNQTIDRLRSITALDYDDDFDYVFLSDVENQIARYFIQIFKDNYAQAKVVAILGYFSFEVAILLIAIKLKNFMAPFNGWVSTVLRLQSYYNRLFSFYHSVPQGFMVLI